MFLLCLIPRILSPNCTRFQWENINICNQLVDALIGEQFYLHEKFFQSKILSN